MSMMQIQITIDDLITRLLVYIIQTINTCVYISLKNFKCQNDTRNDIGLASRFEVKRKNYVLSDPPYITKDPY